MLRPEGMEYYTAAADSARSRKLLASSKKYSLKINNLLANIRAPGAIGDPPNSVLASVPDECKTTVAPVWRVYNLTQLFHSCCDPIAGADYNLNPKPQTR